MSVQLFGCFPMNLRSIFSPAVSWPRHMLMVPYNISVFLLGCSPMDLRSILGQVTSWPCNELAVSHAFSVPSLVCFHMDLRSSLGHVDSWPCHMLALSHVFPISALGCSPMDLRRFSGKICHLVFWPWRRLAVSPSADAQMFWPSCFLAMAQVGAVRNHFSALAGSFFPSHRPCCPKRGCADFLAMLFSGHGACWQCHQSLLCPCRLFLCISSPMLPLALMRRFSGHGVSWPWRRLAMLPILSVPMEAVAFDLIAHAVRVPLRRFSGHSFPWPWRMFSRPGFSCMVPRWHGQLIGNPVPPISSASCPVLNCPGCPGALAQIFGPFLSLALAHVFLPRLFSHGATLAWPTHWNPVPPIPLAFCPVLDCPCCPGCPCADFLAILFPWP